MHNSIPYLLRSALIPELGPDIAAGTSCDVHHRLVPVMTLWTLPDELSVVVYYLYLAVVAAHLAIVALGVQLGIHYIIVDKSDDLQYGRDIVLHIRHLDVADSAARGKMLEFRLEFELGERIYLLGNVNVVAVGDVVLVGYALYLSETLLQALCKLICRAFKRRAVDRKVDVLLCLPPLAGIVHILHYLQCESLCGSCLSYTLRTRTAPHSPAISSSSCRRAACR